MAFLSSKLFLSTAYTVCSTTGMWWPLPPSTRSRSNTYPTCWNYICLHTVLRCSPGLSLQHPQF
ncbi:hypothetical protein E2C01_006560 [Portunus trituberculatus]|uniref:Secreted protein n=1 Tax=Portunus trituberculatus TaxID=210409 RepID=A0A5B7D256_PORTR|nr:hypothetical protein [Portunus trituberculatus]